MPNLVYGAAEAVTYHNGVRVRVHKDEPWNASDPFVAARPDLFVGVPEKVQDTEPAPRKKKAAAKRPAK